jgi:hypothetical protein
VLPTPEKVLRPQPTRDSWQLLVKWNGHCAAEASWEPLATFKENCPLFKLEDELFCQEGECVMDTFFGKQFRRRKKKSQPQAEEQIE